MLPQGISVNAVKRLLKVNKVGIQGSIPFRALLIICDDCSSVDPYILQGASPFSLIQNVVYLAFSYSIERGPSRLMDISMVKQGTSHDSVVFITEVGQPFSIVIDDTYTVLPHHTVPANAIVPGSGIQPVS